MQRKNQEESATETAVKTEAVVVLTMVTIMTLV